MLCPYHSYVPIMKHVSSKGTMSKVVSKASRELSVHLGEAIETTGFCAPSNIDILHVMQFQKCIMSSNTVEAKKIVGVKNTKASARSQPLMLTMILGFPDPDHQEIGTEQSGQLLQASLVVATFAIKEPRIREVFTLSSIPEKVKWPSSTGTRFFRPF